MEDSKNYPTRISLWRSQTFPKYQIRLEEIQADFQKTFALYKMLIMLSWVKKTTSVFNQTNVFEIKVII